MTYSHPKTIYIYIHPKIMAFSPITAWEIEGEKVKVATDFLFLGSKSLQTVTASIKSEDSCFLAGK